MITKCQRATSTNEEIKEMIEFYQADMLFDTRGKYGRKPKRLPKTDRYIETERPEN